MVRLSARGVVTPAGVLRGSVTVSDDGLVAGVSEDRSLTDFDGEWIVPGYIDTHVHGGGGAQFNTSSADEVAAVCGFHARHGTTALLATTVSAPVPELEASLRAIRSAGSGGAGARLLGAHLEGPFISPERPGAMDPETFLAPDPVLGLRLLGLGAPVRMITLAPELESALELIGELARRDVVVSLGHSTASYERTRDAVLAGARSVTHLFNGMPALHHRRPGLLGAALDLPELCCELITDGMHAAAPALRLAARAKGLQGGLRLVTDAIQAAGMPDGEYHLGGDLVRVSGGRVLKGESLAGSTLTMEAAVAGAVRLMGLSVPEAVGLASAVPARLLGLDSRLGSLGVGSEADLLVLDGSLRVLRTMVRGRWAFTA